MMWLPYVREPRYELVKLRRLPAYAVPTPGYLRRAPDAGASGYLLKDSPSDKLADAIRRVHAGGRAVDPELAAEAWGDTDPLTDRERQVLRLAGDGRSGPEIATELELSEGTVRNYNHRLLESGRSIFSVGRLNDGA
jgi:DNA-binding NarL/FixJ family response regulator